jgi:hypothetical protein
MIDVVFFGCLIWHLNVIWCLMLDTHYPSMIYPEHSLLETTENHGQTHPGTHHHTQTHHRSRDGKTTGSRGSGAERTQNHYEGKISCLLFSCLFVFLFDCRFLVCLFVVKTHSTSL